MGQGTYKALVLCVNAILIHHAGMLYAAFIALF